MGYIVKAESKTGKTVRYAGASDDPPVVHREDAHVFPGRTVADRVAGDIRRVIPAGCTVTVEEV